MVLRVASLYFILLSLGCLAPLPLVKLREIGVGFYRFFAMTSLVLGTLGWGLFVWSGDDRYPFFYPAVLPTYLVFVFVFFLSLRTKNPQIIWGSFAITCLLGLGTLGLPWSKYFLSSEMENVAGMAEKMGWGPPWVYMLHALSSALVMGFVTLAMMLGHWYLVTPKLSITPLKRFAGGYILLCAWKALELTVAFLFYVGTSWEMPRTEMGYALAHREIIFVLFRVTWGVVAPLGFSYWIWQTVKMRSTQSATGILYAAMVCTLIGEGIGLFLTLQTGVPF